MLTSLTSLIDGLRWLNLQIERVLNPVFVALIALMLATVVWTVVARLSGISAPWTEKVMLILLPSLAFVTAPVAYRRGTNVALDILVNALPPRGRALHGLILHSAILLLLMIALDLTLRKVGVDPGWLSTVIRGITGLDLSEIRPFRAPIKIPVLGIEWRYVYMVMPAAVTLTILAGIELWLRQLHALLARHPDEARTIRSFEDAQSNVGE